MFRLAAGLAIAAAWACAQSPDAKSSTLHKLVTDWAGLTRYGSENTELRPPAPGENRVVFIGDEITESWTDFFPAKPYINRGITGQTTGQMLVRFHQDVIALQPKVVVIQGGLNDLAGLTGPATEQTIGENFMSMVDIAKANGVRVVIASPTPVCDYFKKQTTLRPQGKIIGLNGWIKRFIAEKGIAYVDYYSALAEGRNFKQDLTVDGFVPNAAGYRVMAPLAQQAIEKAMGGVNR
jgi:lysophospholipase L1-like esterase